MAEAEKSIAGKQSSQSRAFLCVSTAIVLILIGEQASCAALQTTSSEALFFFTLLMCVFLGFITSMREVFIPESNSRPFLDTLFEERKEEQLKASSGK